MLSLVRFNPYRNLVTLPRDVDRFFEDFGLDYSRSDVVWSPTVDLIESENGYEVKAELPGLEKKDIKLTFEDERLTLSGERKYEKEDKKKNYHRVERAYGKFERSFYLPDVKGDEIKADYKEGVLTVSIPKSEATKPKEISVN
jgi:HSP20 family protein